MDTFLKPGLRVCFLLSCILYAKALPKFDVVVIGGGMAGLSAGEYLVNHGISNIAIFEAKERVGGRIHTVYLPSGPIENGAQWIHGAKITNNIYNLANSHGLIEKEKCTSWKTIFIHSEGQQAIDNIYKKFMSEFISYIENHEEANKEISLEQFANNAFETVTANYSPFEKKYCRNIFNTYKLARMFLEGDDLDKVSAFSNYTTIPCDLEIKGGNDQLTDILANNIGDHRIFLEHEVTNVAWNDKGAVLTIRNDDYSFKIAANHVICTVSLGVLKNRSSELFSPDLSKRKLDALNRLRFGRGVKIHLYYEKPFWWRNHLITLQLGYTDDKYLNKQGDWINRIYGFSELPDNPNVLLTVVFGDAASEVELLKESEIGQKITLLLQNYTEDVTIPEPNRVYKSNWIHDRYTLGVYSFGGTSYNGDEFEILSEPLPETGVPRLLFAGEATAPQIYSTMHGARHSGVREAIRVIEQMKKA